MKKIFLVLLLSLLAGCTTFVTSEEKPAELMTPTKFKRPFPEPEAGQPIVLAVYSFQDKTGQKKDSASVAKFSTAVTQGGEALLLKALADVGDGKWFKIVERIGLDNLLKERQLIRSARDEAKEPNILRPILYAGMIVEGGIVSYDSNQKTGGFGMAYLGVGPQTNYQEDIVTVSLRAINVQTGEVMLTVNAQKTILSVASSISTFKFLNKGTESFENEFGVTSTEPGVFAVKAAVELAVEEMVYEGQRKGLWAFKQKEEK